MFAGYHIGPTYDFVDFFSCILLRQASKPDAYIYIACLLETRLSETKT